MRLFLGIDLGTSGCRATVIDADGEVLANADCPLPPSDRDSDGKSEQDPQAWFRAVTHVCREVCRSLGNDSRNIVSLAINGTSATLLAATPEGEPLSPGLMYDDRQAHLEADFLRGVAPGVSPVLTPSASLPKLLLLQKRLQQPFKALHQADWILGRLCGIYGVSDENNALKMGYDPIERCWPGWMKSLQLPDGILPGGYPVATGIGRLTAQAAEQTGLHPDTLICTGTTDSTASSIATGIDTPGQGVTVLGSTLVVKILSANPVFSAPHGVYSHRLGELWLVGGASNSGGAVLLDQFSRAQLTEMTPRLQPQRPTGLSYYPLRSAGERFPVNDPELPPRLTPRPDDDVTFFQGMLESMADIEVRAYRLLEELGTPAVSEIYSIGGGADNAPWSEIRQQKLRVPVHTSSQREAAYGSALLAKQGFFTING